MLEAKSYFSLEEVKSVDFSMKLPEDFDKASNKEYVLFLSLLEKFMSIQDSRLGYFVDDFGQLISIDYNQYSSCETHRTWWNGDESVRNRNPILLKGQFSIKFRL